MRQVTSDSTYVCKGFVCACNQLLHRFVTVKLRPVHQELLDPPLLSASLMSGCQEGLNLAGGSTGDPAVFGIVTVSDRASAGVYDDASGPAILEFFHEAVKSKWTAVYKIIPDERPLIEQTLKEMCDKDHCCLVVTTGGTGPAPRDVTPEATEAVCERMMPGYGEQMRAISLKYVPTAVLSRQTAGLRGQSLIINLPGKPKAIRETFDEVFCSVPACVDLIEGPYIETNEAVVKAFRPSQLQKKS